MRRRVRHGIRARALHERVVQHRRLGDSTDEVPFVERAGEHARPSRGNDIVGVAEQDPLSPCGTNTGIPCAVCAPSRTGHDPHRRKPIFPPSQDLSRAVGGSVVDDDQFPRFGELLAREGAELLVDGSRRVQHRHARRSRWVGESCPTRVATISRAPRAAACSRSIPASAAGGGRTDVTTRAPRDRTRRLRHRIRRASSWPPVTFPRSPRCVTEANDSCSITAPRPRRVWPGSTSPPA